MSWASQEYERKEKHKAVRGTGGEVYLENQKMVVAGCTSWWWEEKSRDSRCVVGMEGDLLVSFLSL